jgi:hypothetical protein
MAGSKKGKAQIAKLPAAKNNEEHVYAASHAARRLPLPVRMSSSRRFGFPALEHLRCVSLCVVLPFLALKRCAGL